MNTREKEINLNEQAGLIDLESIFSTKERIKILNYILYLEEEFGVNETSRILELSKGFVSLYFSILLNKGIISKKGTKFIINNNSYVKSIKIVLNILGLNVRILEKCKFVKAAGLYGSCAKGTNTKNSDVDLWIKVNGASDEKLAKLSSQLREKVTNLKLLVLDNKKIEKIKKEDSLFYNALFFGSIIIYGDENEL